MDVPEGIKNKYNEGLICKLKRALYGLKQAQRSWKLKIDPFLISSLSFQKCDGDPCLFVKQAANQAIMIIAL